MKRPEVLSPEEGLNGRDALPVAPSLGPTWRSWWG
jgi:CIC family chloride channel protein